MEKMPMKLKKIQIVLIIVIVATMVAGTVAFAKGKPQKPDDDYCKWSDLNCLDVWIPVICNDGVIYSNACYAMRACATGCVPYGDPIPVLPL
jgi:hypothetical protein